MYERRSVVGLAVRRSIVLCSAAMLPTIQNKRGWVLVC